MLIDEQNNNSDSPEPDNIKTNEAVPIGIARIREEWRAAGLVEDNNAAAPEDIVFPEVDGGAGIGDYTLDMDTIKVRLALSQEALDRLIATGEIDSILVASPSGIVRRMVSESSINRFQVDSAIDPDAVQRAAKAMSDESVTKAIEDLTMEITDLRNTQGKILQQMKDMLLLEVRNLKEQDRDLTSFVYELAEEVRKSLNKKK